MTFGKQLLLSLLVGRAIMDPVTLKLAKKKCHVFQCLYEDCSQHGDRVTMVKHKHMKHTVEVNVPFRCSICNFVSIVGEGVNQTCQMVPPTQEPGERIIWHHQRKTNYIRVKFKALRNGRTLPQSRFG